MSFGFSLFLVLLFDADRADRCELVNRTSGPSRTVSRETASVDSDTRHEHSRTVL